MRLKKILLVTYHFPPSAASGTFRLLGFARHLPTFGWQPLVVAPPSLPWEPIDPQLADQIPAQTIVRQVPYPAGSPKLFGAAGAECGLAAESVVCVQAAHQGTSARRDSDFGTAALRACAGALSQAFDRLAVGR